MTKDFFNLPVGSIFDFGGFSYCVMKRPGSCSGCSFWTDGSGCLQPVHVPFCSSVARYDGKSVYFVELVDVFAVILDGNCVVKTDSNKKPCMRRCLSLARKKNNYVELWYYQADGSRVLLNYWN